MCPKGHDAWLESHSMRYGRIRFQQVLRDAGVGGRVRLVYPSVTNGERAIDTMVHSKLMIVDDRILRIGSANLNNRSMGTDTECDLAIVAAHRRGAAANRPHPGPASGRSLRGQRE